VSAEDRKTTGVHVAPSTGRLAAYTGWNLFGFCAPMIVAVVAIPLLIRYLGPDRFGTFSLVWMVIGYFSIFDMGLGRAMTRFIAERLGRQRHDEVPGIFWTAMGLMVGLGLAGAALAAGLTPWLVYHRLQIPVGLRPEVAGSFFIAAAGLPVVVATAGLIGVLEAHQHFRLINVIRMPMGIYTFLGPLAVLPFTQNLFVVVAVLMLGRVAECLIYFIFCLREVPALRTHRTFCPALVGPLFGFGGWMTVSDIAMPLLVHIDRFLIGSVLSVSAVTYYVTPAEVVVKFLIFPRAWISVLFPTFAARHATDPHGTANLYARGVKFLMAVSFPAALVLTGFAGEGLGLWLGPEFAVRSTPVMRWLTAGIFVYSLAYVPFSLLQGCGRPDLSARLHVAEVACYAFLSVFLIHRLGIEGAALAWFLRSLVDAVGMFWLAHRFAPGSGRAIARSAAVTAVALVSMAVVVCIPQVAMRLAAVPLLLAVFALLVWFWLFSGEERQSLLELVRNGIGGLTAKRR